MVLASARDFMYRVYHHFESVNIHTRTCTQPQHNQGRTDGSPDTWNMLTRSMFSIVYNIDNDMLWYKVCLHEYGEYGFSQA